MPKITSSEAFDETLVTNKITSLPANIVLITGASRGIGAATAILFAEQGYDVCINYRVDAVAAQAVVTKLIKVGVRAIAVQADVSIEVDVIRLFNTLDDELGRLDVLVNNAGILLPQMRLQDMQADRINAIFSTNVTSYFLCCREAVLRMSTKKAGKGGAIVNVSSKAAKLAHLCHQACKSI